MRAPRARMTCLDRRAHMTDPKHASNKMDTSVIMFDKKKMTMLGGCCSGSRNATTFGPGLVAFEASFSRLQRKSARTGESALFFSMLYGLGGHMSDVWALCGSIL